MNESPKQEILTLGDLLLRVAAGDNMTLKIMGIPISHVAVDRETKSIHLYPTRPLRELRDV